jgi:hypothetical protein
MKYFASGLFLLIAQLVFSQTSDVLLDQRYHHLIDRQDIKKPSGFTAVKPYYRKDVLQRLKTPADSLNDAYLLIDNYLFNDSNLVEYQSKKPILKYFYRNKADFYAYRGKDFNLAVNPVYELKMGGKMDNGDWLFQNSRGLEIKGNLDQKLGFYSLLTDNQLRVSDYVAKQIQSSGAVSGENFWNSYRTTGFDFLSSVGYLNFSPIKHVRIKFGYDKNFIGDGYRSLILSGNAGNYTHLKIDTKIWKINYTNIFADMTADINYGAFGTSGAKNYPRKFVSIHHLGINLRKNLNIGVFESIVAGGDTAGASQFDLNYLNPMIFYRSIERDLGSGGNAIMGGNFKWNFLNHFSLYGQVILDEMVVKHVLARDGWWANKYGGQAGLKYIDVAGIQGLDLQIEGNFVRPYTFSHTFKTSSYSHFNQSLAHPLGANFRELLSIVRYQPNQKIFLVAKLFYIQKGLDYLGENYGGNVLSVNTTRIKRPQELGHNLLQGDKTTIQLLSFTASYMIKHNVFFDLEFLHRQSKSVFASPTKDTYLRMGLRMNLAQRVFEY